jgi:hypothetical protein
MRYAQSFAAASLLALGGCGLIAFDVDQDLPEQTIQGNPLGGVLPGAVGSPFALNVDLKTETQKRNTGPASSANLSALRFTATPHAAPAGNFDFVDEIHVFIDSPGSPLPKKEIASLKPVPKGQTTINLAVTSGVDLLPYINAGAEITATATGRQPSQDFHFDGHVTITVHI